MRVCLICAEFFGWGTRGGFGYATRVIGRELVKRGIEVTAVVPRPRGIAGMQAELDGVRVIGIDRNRPFGAAKAYRAVNADVYHSQQPSLASWVAQEAMPDRVHLATLRDPRAPLDWWRELRHPTHSAARVILTWLYYENRLARRAIRRMDGLYTPAEYLRRKSQRLYRLHRLPGLLPTPVEVPPRVEKSERPTACFVGRWDRVKRPALFFELARSFPDVEFLAIGKAHNAAYERALRARYRDRENLKLIGYVDQFASDALSRYLGQSWVLVNTSAKEALPNTFVEACAHRCAILSAQNPDGFATRFGRQVRGDDFAGGLRALLENERWRELGRLGHAQVVQSHSLEAAAERHLRVYEELLAARRGRAA
ncbi:MAG: glycosyltransferase family 4 protein [Chromatiales bacterium]